MGLITKVFILALLFFPFGDCLLFSSTALGESANQIKLTETQVREQMIQISKELGVSCNECHNVQNFKSAEMEVFKTAKDHMKLVEVLRHQGLDGRNGPEASCYMCHRGKMKYQYELKEKK